MADVLKLEATPDGIYLSSTSKDYTENNVYALLKSNGILRYDFKAIRKFIIDGQRCKVCGRNPALEKDARIVVNVSSDKMSATVTIDPPFFAKPWPTKEEILKAMIDKGIKYGIDNEAIETLVFGQLANEPVTIANGTPPVEGRDAYIELLKDPDKPIEVADDERVDFWNLSTILIVHPGDEVARKHPLIPGTDGYDVTGRAVKVTPSRNIEFDFGNGLKRDDADPLLLIASAEGQLKNTAGRLEVLQELQIHKDINFDTGSIDFTGSVTIKGSVRENFHVNAQGNIDISGTVEGAYIDCGGSLYIHAGVRGTGKAEIKAEGDITLSFCDQCTISSGGIILVQNEILHSNLFARKAVIATRGANSQIVGGKVSAGLEVACNELGTDVGTKTEIFVGLPPDQIIGKDRTSLKKEIEDLRAELERTETNMEYLKGLAVTGDLDEEKRATLINLTRTRLQLQSNIDAKEIELKDIEEKIDSYKGKGIVRVRGNCHPGVVINIRGYAYKVIEPCIYVSFVPDDEKRKIVLQPFNYLAGQLGGAGKQK